MALARDRKRGVLNGQRTRVKGGLECGQWWCASDWSVWGSWIFLFDPNQSKGQGHNRAIAVPLPDPIASTILSQIQRHVSFHLFFPHLPPCLPH